MDIVFIKELLLRVSLTSTSKLTCQPVYVTVFAPTDIREAAETDDVNLTVDYAKLSAEITGRCDDKSFPTLLELVKAISDLCPPGATIEAEQTRGHYRAGSIGLRLMNVKKSNSDDYEQQVQHVIQDIRVCTIIGVNPEERFQKQFVVVDVKFGDTDSSISETVDSIAELVESSNFFTVEALAHRIASRVQDVFQVKGDIKVDVAKPDAVTFAKGVGVTVTRKEHEASLSKLKRVVSIEPPKCAVAYIGFGSNIEPRVDFISRALKRIHDNDRIKVMDTSFMYESLPMYFLEQECFYNGVAKVITTWEPVELLQALKQIEVEVGRQNRFENGPREIDLDILYYVNGYGLDRVSTDALTIPHPRIRQREFVLRPLADLHDNFMEKMGVNPTVMLKSLMSKEPSTVQKVLPLWSPQYPEPRQLKWNSKTFIMGILNMSPDSFSEPGITNAERAAKAALKMVADGVDLIDIGAVSRSPGRTESMSTRDEIEALTSVIKLLRAKNVKVPISVDVFKAEVAEAAIRAGADIINDVGMAVRDPGMKKVAAKLGVPIVFMHTRGSPSDMHNYTEYDNDNVVGEVISELNQVVKDAIVEDIFRWNIILDPGIGFAKTGDQNLEILKNLKKFKSHDSPVRGFPLLIGCSRKKFIGTLTDVEDPLLRGPGTMASTAASICEGADIIRVHDVLENIQVAKFADAFWRN